MKKVQDIINAMTDDELDKSLKQRTEYRKEKYPTIEFSKEISYRVVEAKTYGKHEGNGYFLQYKWWQDEWNDVTDLSEMKIYEYNELVDLLNKHYPDYPIEYLEGRFV
tara:strand:- start:1094 stop:1417 length:324 start_codon:yes stop_codon:yes gene_type:complete